MNKLIAVNGSNRDFADHLFILAIGVYGWTRLMVWADSIEEALNEAVDWIAENEPDQLCDKEVHEAYEEALAAGKSEEEAQADAEVDTLCAGNSGHYLRSDDWTIVAEDPSRTEILSIRDSA